MCLRTIIVHVHVHLYVYQICTCIFKELAVYFLKKALNNDSHSVICRLKYSPQPTTRCPQPTTYDISVDRDNYYFKHVEIDRIL